MKHFLSSDCQKDYTTKDNLFSCSETLTNNNSQLVSSSNSSVSTSSSGAVKRKLTRKPNFACIPKHDYAYLFDAVYLNNSIRMRENSDQSTRIATDAVNKRFFNGEKTPRDVSKHYLCPHFTHNNTTPCFISERYGALKEHLLTHKDSYYYCYGCETKFYNKNKALIHFNTICNHLPNRDNGLIAYLVIDLQKETIKNFKKYNPLKYQVLSKDEFHMASLASKKSYGFQLPYNSDGTIDTSNLKEYVTSAVARGSERKRAKLNQTNISTKKEITLTSTKEKIHASINQWEKIESTEKRTSKVVDPEATRRLLGCTERIVNSPDFLPSLKSKKLLNPNLTCYVRSSRAGIPIAKPHILKNYNSFANNTNQLNTRLPFPVYQVTNNSLFMQDLMNGHFDARQRFLSNISKRPFPGPIAFPYPNNQRQVMNPHYYSNFVSNNNNLTKQVLRKDTSRLNALATVCTIAKKLEEHKNPDKQV